MDNESLVWVNEWMRRLAASETNADTRFTLASTTRKKRMQLADWKNGASKARKHIASMKFEWSLSQYVNDDHDTSDQLGSTLQSANGRCSDWWKPCSTSYCRYDRQVMEDWQSNGRDGVKCIGALTGYNEHTHTRAHEIPWSEQSEQAANIGTCINNAYTPHTNHLGKSRETLVSLSVAFLFIEVWATTMWIWWRAWSMFVLYFLLSITRENSS